MRRTVSQSSSKHTRGNINPSNMITPPMFRNVLRMFQTEGLGGGCRPYFVVSGKISGNQNLPRLPHLMKVLLTSPAVFQPRLLNRPSVSVSDDDCREAVADLNHRRWMRAEDLGDGYDVSDILCYNFIDATSKLPIQCLEELVFTPTIKAILVKYIDGMMSVLLCPVGSARI
jgi:hypothetical protein